MYFLSIFRSGYYRQSEPPSSTTWVCMFTNSCPIDSDLQWSCHFFINLKSLSVRKNIFFLPQNSRIIGNKYDQSSPYSSPPIKPGKCTLHSHNVLLHCIRNWFPIARWISTDFASPYFAVNLYWYLCICKRKIACCGLNILGKRVFVNIINGCLFVFLVYLLCICCCWL